MLEYHIKNETSGGIQYQLYIIFTEGSVKDVFCTIYKKISFSGKFVSTSFDIKSKEDAKIIAEALLKHCNGKG